MGWRRGRAPKRRLGRFLGFSALVGAYQIPLTAPDASPFTPDFEKLVADT